MDALSAVSLGMTIVFTGIGATWVLSNKISSMKAELSKEITALRLDLEKAKTEVTVLRTQEEAKAEKLQQMWQWWLKTIEKGWIANFEPKTKGAASGG